ncbi:MAG: hypothetical protein RLZZ65_1096 [Bacteroidota bacterium]|jgi:hypothetical protein
MKKQKLITIQDSIVTISKINGNDYICLSDMAKAKSDNSRSADVIKNWIRTRYTLEFLGTWELLYNPNFKVVEFNHFKIQAGLHSFVLSANLWMEKTNAIGIYSKPGRYGGTYAHKDIAFEFASSISPEFKLYLIKEFQRLQELEKKIVLSNLENINSLLISQGEPQFYRLIQLNNIAISQMKSLINYRKKLQ